MVKGADYRGLIISQSSFEAGMEFKRCGYFDLNLANAKRKEVTFFFFPSDAKEHFFFAISIIRSTASRDNLLLALMLSADKKGDFISNICIHDT